MRIYRCQSGTSRMKCVEQRSPSVQLLFRTLVRCVYESVTNNHKVCLQSLHLRNGYCEQNLLQVVEIRWTDTNREFCPIQLIREGIVRALREKHRNTAGIDHITRASGPTCVRYEYLYEVIALNCLPVVPGGRAQNLVLFKVERYSSRRYQRD